MRPVPTALFVASIWSTLAVAAPATVVVLRAPSAAMGGMNLEVQVEGLGLVTLGPKACVVLEPAASARTLLYRWRAGPLGNPNLETEYTPVALALSAGRTQYLQLVAKTESAPNRSGRLDTTTTWTMESVTEADVKPALARCKPATN